MKTNYYTLSTWNEDAMAAGYDSGQTAPLRRAGETAYLMGGDSKVIDLAAWRAANLDMPVEEPDWPEEDGDEREEPELCACVRRVRTDQRAVVISELVSTLCVAAVAGMLVLRVLAF